VLPDRHRPAGRPRLEVPVGKGSAMVFAPDGRGLWVASPGVEKVVEKWALHRLGPVSVARSSARSRPRGPVNRLAVTPDGRYLVGAVLGLHRTTGGAKRTANRTRKWRTASLVVVGDSEWPGPPQGGCECSVRHQDRDRPARCVPGPLARRKNVTAWIQRGATDTKDDLLVDGNEPVVHLGRVRWGPLLRSERPPSAPWSGCSTSATTACGAGPRRRPAPPLVRRQGRRARRRGPAPFRSMLDGPSAERSIRDLSGRRGRAYDTGAWPPRPSGVRFPPPAGSCVRALMAQSRERRFTATWLTWVRAMPTLAAPRRTAGRWRIRTGTAPARRLAGRRCATGRLCGRGAARVGHRPHPGPTQVAVNRPFRALCHQRSDGQLPCGWWKRTPDGRGGQAPVS